jgi:protein TonB
MNRRSDLDDAEDDAEDQGSGWLGGGRIVSGAMGLMALLLLIGMVLMVRHFLSSTLKPHKMIQEITLLRPPPPPPPPKPEEKPPEPEIKKDEVKLDQPKDEPKPDNEPPPALKPLGLDADASGAGDSFGLAANKGGRGIETTAGMSEGPGGNGGGPVIRRDPSEAYNRKIKSLIQDALTRDKKLQGYNYTVKVALAPQSEGGFSVTLRDSTGDPKADAALLAALELVAATLPAAPNASTRVIKINSRS